MNYTAYEVIKKEKQDSKYVVLLGNAHSSTSEEVPGMREILGCPTLCIEDSTSNDLKIGVENYLDEIEKADVVLKHMEPLMAIKNTAGYQEVNSKLAKDHLEKQEVGTYLIRESKEEPKGMRKQFLITVRQESEVKEYPVNVTLKGEFVFTESDGQTISFKNFSFDEGDQESLMSYLKNKNIISKPSGKVKLEARP